MHRRQSARSYAVEFVPKTKIEIAVDNALIERLSPGAAANVPGRGRPQTATGRVGEGFHSCVS
jgi:hypothetical protein